MGSLLVSYALLLLLLPASLTSGGPLYRELIRPNFTASHFEFIDLSGAFLISPNGDFKASIASLKTEESHFYFSVIHSLSNTIVWSANRNKPISTSAKLSLNLTGMSISDDSQPLMWSTPPLNSTVSFLRLGDDGNLILLDKSNNSLWESFGSPTDVIIIGQRLPVGKSLVGGVKEEDSSEGDYRLTVTNNDAVLQWNGLTYWKLSMDTKAYVNSYSPVSFMAMNETGLYLFDEDDRLSVVLMQGMLAASSFRIAKLDFAGKFTVKSFINSNWVQEFVGPTDDCWIPYFCGSIGLCRSGACSCPTGFHTDGSNCVPLNTTLSLPAACRANGNISSSNSVVSYMKLGYGIDYFANFFMDPSNYGLNSSVCRDLCTKNCSCLGYFFRNPTGSCYMLENRIGSIMLSATDVSDRLGYIKVLVGNPNPNSRRNDKNFPIIGLVLLPSSGFILLITMCVLGFFWLKSNKMASTTVVKSFNKKQFTPEELEILTIPGLPVRFDFEELVAATDNFSTQIGSGGFGVVYKGILPDKTPVAVKRLTSLGGQGKKEFCAEIAIIGNIHHVNLVRLIGFCLEGSQRLLVYEYMNRGSLDKTLFDNSFQVGPVLEWQERVEIAIGTARGLAYLHSQCQHKIIHCDVKPENILLDDNFSVKISDFGLSKLLSPEQSSHFTTLRGTRGYLAPEWLTSSTISDKTDVYSFGMVLLEIVRGKKNCVVSKVQGSLENNNNENSFSPGSCSRPGQVYFPLFALEMHEERRYLDLADPRLEGRVSSEEVEKLVRVALCCLHEEPMLRPSMLRVVSMLEGVVPLVEPRVESLNFLRFCGRRFTEASAIEGDNSLYPLEVNATLDSNTQSSSQDSLSHISSQQVSGPR